MKVWFKRVLISLVVVVIVAFVGIAIFLLTFDPNAYKSKLEEIVYNRYHRSLSIKGDIELSLFPRIGLFVRDVSLSNRNGTDTFASLDSARFAVAIWPLMFNRLVVDHVAVTGFKAWITRDEHGNFNFRDLIARQGRGVLPSPVLVGAALPALPAFPLGRVAGAQAVPVAYTQEPAGTDFRIDIAGLDLKNGEIHLYDNKTGAVARIVKLDVNTGRMTFDQAFDVALKGKLIGDYPVADANIDGQALVRFNPDQQSYSAQKLNLHIAGKLGELSAKTVALRGNLAYSAFSQMFSASGLELNMQGEVGGATPIKGLDTSLVVPQLKVDRGRAELQVEKLAYRAKGTMPDQAFDIAFDAPHLAVSPESAKGEPVSGTVKLTGKGSVLGISLGMSGLGGNASKLTLKELKIDGGLKEGARLLQLKMTSPANWDVFAEKGGLSAMKGDMRIEDAALPGGSFEFPFIGSLQADLLKDELVSELNAVLSGSKLDFRVKATQLKSPKVAFGLTADKLDFNTLFPPPAPPKPPPAPAAPAAEKAGETQPAPPKEPPKPAAKPQAKSDKLDFAFLDSVDLTGTVAIGELKIQNLQASDFAANLRAAQGKLSIDGIKANLYNGRLSGAVTADSKNAVAADMSLDNLALGLFLHDLAQEERLAGTGSLKIKLNSQGQTTAALEAGLSGAVQARVRDGAIKGIDVMQTLREVNDVVRNMFSGQLPDVLTQFDMGRRTNFTSLDVDVALSQGQGTVKKLDLVAPLLHVTQGTPATVDLVNDQLDLMLNVRLSGAKPAGQQEAELPDLKGVTVPMRVSGPFNKLGYQVQWKEIGSKVVKDAVRGGLIDLLNTQIGKPPEPAAAPDAPKKAADPVKSIGDAIKGLLGK